MVFKSRETKEFIVCFDVYKIHIQPKNKYILYTLFRLFTIMKQNELFHNKKIMGKFLLTPRFTHPNPDNVGLAGLNGGVAPVIVIYCNSDSEQVKNVLSVLLKEFEREVDIIGSMTTDYKYRVVPFNVRLNSLLFYAQGDRTMKLHARANHTSPIMPKRYTTYITKILTILIHCTEMGFTT